MWHSIRTVPFSRKPNQPRSTFVNRPKPIRKYAAMHFDLNIVARIPTLSRSQLNPFPLAFEIYSSRRVLCNYAFVFHFIDIRRARRPQKEPTVSQFLRSHLQSHVFQIEEEIFCI